MTHPPGPQLPPPPPSAADNRTPATPMPPTRRAKKHLYFGAGGLVLGLLVGGVGVALLEALPSSSGIDAAVTTCAAEDTEGVWVMDDGASVELETSGEESDGAPMATVVCVLQELQAPQSLYSRIDSTRALDGTMDARWDGYAASWTYHPDNGLHILVEVER